jgi:hypothetical protein
LVGTGALLGMVISSPLIAMLLTGRSPDFSSGIWDILNWPGTALGYGLAHLWYALRLPRGGLDGWEPLIYSWIVAITVQWALLVWGVSVVVFRIARRRTSSNQPSDRTR